jgi:peptide/nickel transport system substrate-binding protein
MPQETDSSRRSYLRLVAAGFGTSAAAALAGCNGTNSQETAEGGGTDGDDSDGGDDSDSDTDTASQGDERLDKELRIPASTADSTLSQFTHLFSKPGLFFDTSAPEGHLIYEPLTLYNARKGEFEYFGAEDMSVDGETLRIKLAEDLKWHNGDDITAEDVAMEMKYGLAKDQAPADGNIWGPATAPPQVTGDYTIEIPLDGSYNEDLLLKQGWNSEVITLPPEFTRQWVEMADEATLDPNRNSHTDISREIAAKIAGGDPNPDDNVNTDIEPQASWGIDDYTSGLFKPVEVNAGEMTLELFEDHPDADNVNFTTITLVEIGEGQLVPQMRNGRINAARGQSINQASAQSLPDYWKNINRLASGGWNVTFRHTESIYTDHRIKQAFAHVIGNRSDDILANYGEFAGGAVPTDYSSIVGPARDRYSDLVDSFTTYGSLDRATALLEDAGYSKDGDTWTTPEGETFAPKLYVDSNDVRIGLAESVRGIMQSFGIQMEVVTQEGSVYWSQMPDSQLELMIEFWGNPDFPSPFFTLQRDLVGANAGYSNFAFDNDGNPTSHQVPPLGEPNGSMETVTGEDMRSMFDTLLSTSDQQEYQDTIRQLAWIRNQAVPNVPLVARRDVNFFDSNWGTWPDQENETYGGTAFPQLANMPYSLRKGLIEATDG